MCCYQNVVEFPKRIEYQNVQNDCDAAFEFVSSWPILASILKSSIRKFKCVAMRPHNLQSFMVFACRPVGRFGPHFHPCIYHQHSHFNERSLLSHHSNTIGIEFINVNEIISSIMINTPRHIEFLRLSTAQLNLRVHVII